MQVQTEKLTHVCQNGFLKTALPLSVQFWLLPHKLHRRAHLRQTNVYKNLNFNSSLQFEWLVLKTIHANVWGEIRKCAFSSLTQSRGCARAGCVLGWEVSVWCKSVHGWGVGERGCSCRRWCRCRREKWRKDTSRKRSGGCTVQSSIK